MNYAQIKDNEVKNVIILNDPTIEHIFLEGYDYIKRVDNLNPQPAREYTYDPETDEFTPPPLEE